MGNTSDKTKALVLTDGKGNWYAIPAEMLERHKVTGERKAEIEELFGDSVSGYGFQMEARGNQALTGDPTQLARPGELNQPTVASRWAEEASSAVARAQPASMVQSFTNFFGALADIPGSIANKE